LKWGYYSRYAADAYAIFCAGRATEVVPEDHMLVVYWKFVCKLSLTQVGVWFSKMLNSI
jgi:hypothetical protein